MQQTGAATGPGPTLVPSGERPPSLWCLVKGPTRRDSDFQSNNALEEMGLKPKLRTEPSPEEARQRAAPSGWDTLEAARQLSEQWPSIGEWIAQLDVGRLPPAVVLEPTGDGHYLIWSDPDTIAAAEQQPRILAKDATQ